MSLNIFQKFTKKSLEKRYNKLLFEAMNLQRGGKIPEFYRKTAEADAVLEKLNRPISR